MPSFYFIYRHKVIPYVRMTQRGKFVKKNARDYIASKEALAWSLKEQMKERKMFPDRTPFEIEITYIAPNAFQFDIDNLVKAVLDAAQGIVFRNDMWCQCIRRAVKFKGESYELSIKIQEFSDFRHGKSITPQRAQKLNLV